MSIQDSEVFDILVGKVSSAINRAFLRAFAIQGVEITTEQWSVLACLWNQDNVTQQALCELTTKDKPSMTRLIDKLEAKHLVVREADFTDRRINLIHLTDEGRALKSKADEIVASITQKTLQGVTETEIDVCRTALKKIMSNLK